MNNSLLMLSRSDSKNPCQLLYKTIEHSCSGIFCKSRNTLTSYEMFIGVSKKTFHLKSVCCGICKKFLHMNVPWFYTVTSRDFQSHFVRASTMSCPYELFPARPWIAFTPHYKQSVIVMHHCTYPFMGANILLVVEHLQACFRRYLSFYWSNFDNIGLVGKLRSCSIWQYQYRQYRRYQQRPVSAYR